jgi:hypothetical protein
MVGATPAIHTPYAFPTSLSGNTGREADTTTLRTVSLQYRRDKSFRGLDNVSDHGGKEDEKEDTDGGASEGHDGMR